MKPRTKLKIFSFIHWAVALFLICSRLAKGGQTTGFLTTSSASPLSLGSCTDSRSVTLSPAANVYVDGNLMRHNTNVAVIFANGK
jgi:hypothetical protein